MFKTKTTLLDGKNITYKVRKNPRAKRVKISIDRSGSLVLTLPWYIGENIGETFLKSQSAWVFKQIERINDLKLQTNLLQAKYPKYKESRKDAEKILKAKLKEVNEFYNFKYNRITIKNQSTCWGSCSRHCNLNFNYKLAYMPDKFADYVITHELCHLQELNHSKRFWDLVKKRLPDYKEVQKEMKHKGLELR